MEKLVTQKSMTESYSPQQKLLIKLQLRSEYRNRLLNVKKYYFFLNWNF